MTKTSVRGKIASLCPGSTSEVQLYSIPSGVEIDGRLRITNLTGNNATFRVAHCVAGKGDNSAAPEEWIAYDVTIEAGKISPEIFIHGNATETIRVKSSVSNGLAFHLSGSKRITSN